MPQGKVKWFNNAKGYGFIIEDGDSEDLFAHFSAIQMEGYKTLKAGERVSFDKEPSAKGIHAINIVPLDRPVGNSGSGQASRGRGEQREQESRQNQPPGAQSNATVSTQSTQGEHSMATDEPRESGPGQAADSDSGETRTTGQPGSTRLHSALSN
ncbi:MAG: cold shock domain-containing protein [Oleiphilaceae bacterium]|nr:cold shock domain-containing protein [Oleiphilaceae bacterium]